MKTLKIKFTDFWPNLDETNNFIYNTLSAAYNLEISNTPDYVFYANFGYEHLNYPDAVRVFFSGENQTPDFNLCDYAIGFHFITFEDRYLRVPLFYLYDTDLLKASQKHQITPQEALIKKLFCNFIYSNKNADPKREAFFHLLEKYKSVHSGGGHLNNMGGERVANKFDLQVQTKFTIAFENSSSNGYTTEKILQAFSAQTIPIYWGNPKVVEDFNPGSFINCHDYASFEEVVEKVKEVDNDDELFVKMLQTPIHSGEQTHYDFYTEKIEFFLQRIVKVDKSEAFRRNRMYWGAKYEQRMRKKMLEVETQDKGLLKRVINRLK